MGYLGTTIIADGVQIYTVEPSYWTSLGTIAIRSGHWYWICKMISARNASVLVKHEKAALWAANYW